MALLVNVAWLITQFALLQGLRDAVAVHLAEVARADAYAAGVQDHVAQAAQNALRRDHDITRGVRLQTHTYFVDSENE